MTADEAPVERLHPLAVLSGFGQAVRNMVGGLLAGGYFAFQGHAAMGLLIVGGIMGAALIGLFLHWWRFSFRVGEDAVRIDSGIVSRNHRTIPFDRVADVSIAQGPLQRLLAVARVTLETGSSTVGQEEGLLSAVALARAEALRDHVRARRGMSHVAAPEGEAEPAPLFAMDVRRVLTCGLFNFSLALFAGLFGASQTLGDLFNIDPFEREFWQPLLVESGLGEWLLAHRFGLAAGGLAVLILAGILTGIVRTTLREWGFRLDRTGRGLRRRRGLLTRTDVSLPKRRIQAGVITSGPVRERLGWHALSVKSLASDSKNDNAAGSDHALAPLATWTELEAIAGELDWRLPGDGTGWRPVSRAHLWSFLILFVPLVLLIAGAAGLSILLTGGDGPANAAGEGQRVERGLLFVGLIAASVLTVGALLRWLEWKRTFYALEGERLLVRSGWWSRETLLLPLAKVQSVDLVETSLSRAFRVAHLGIGIAGGKLMGHRIPSLPRKEASQLRRLVLSRQS